MSLHSSSGLSIISWDNSEEIDFTLLGLIFLICKMRKYDQMASKSSGQKENNFKSCTTESVCCCGNSIACCSYAKGASLQVDGSDSSTATPAFTP